MDTSETYIKMCEKAVEIQEGHIQLGDYFAIIGSDEGDLDGVNLFHDGKCVKRVVEPYDSLDVQDAILAFGGKYIWLPRQDQLQEMVTGKGVLSGDWLDVLDHFVMDEGGLFDFFDAHRIDETYNYVKSMEQLWLAFVMKEKYKKVWDGEEWQ